MCSTPLICCSSGEATVLATTSADAPGYWPVTLMTGGAISGYCAIGSRPIDTRPRITNTTEITAAKIGRSMKKCEMRIALTDQFKPGMEEVTLSHGRRCRQWPLLGRNLGAGGARASGR